MCRRFPCAGSKKPPTDIHEFAITLKSPNTYRRMIVGILSVGLLIAAVLLFFSYGPELGWNNVFVGVCLRLGLVLGAIWLAWPQVAKLANVLPRVFLIGGGLILAAGVIYSRLLPIAVAIIVVAIVLQLVMRYFASRTRG